MDKCLLTLQVLGAVCLIWPVQSQYDLPYGFGLQPDTDFNRVLSGLSNYTDLCSFMSPGDCDKLTEEVEFAEQSGDKVAVSGGGPKVAKFDACNPRMQTIAIPRHHDPEIIIWPPCTRARRCGGCCTSDVFSCEPTATKDKYVKVFDTKLAYPGAQRFTFVGIRNVRIVEHTQCDAQCKTKAHECHKYQIYRHRKCRCECRPERMKLRSTCHKNQIWDDSECDCICPNRATVECPPPFRFSTTTCKCTIKTEVTGEIDLDELVSKFDQNLDLISKNDHIPNMVNIASLFSLTGGLDGRESFMNSIDRVNEAAENEGPEVTSDVPVIVTDAQTTTTTPKTTTKTTTTEPPTTTTTVPTTTTTKEPKLTCEDTHKCRGNWRPMTLRNGKCDCRPPIFFKMQKLRNQRKGPKRPPRIQPGYKVPRRIRG